jgi:PleD family two-component response regulator
MHLDGLEIPPFFSVGVAVFEPGVATIGDLFKQADNALYESKQKGGNQYVQYSD